MSNKHPASGGKLSQIWLDKAAFHYDAHVHLVCPFARWRGNLLVMLPQI